MTKKRKDHKYPNLVPKYNLKKRQDYMDNHFYVDRLPEDAKEYLNDFNGEYYNAGFKDSWNYDNVHVCQVDKETIKDLKAQIKTLKASRKKIYSKSPNTTTEADRAVSARLTEKIEDIEAFLFKVHPRMEIERNNYARNMDILTHGKASNEFEIVSWEELDDNMLGELDPELYIQAMEDDDE